MAAAHRYSIIIILKVRCQGELPSEIFTRQTGVNPEIRALVFTGLPEKEKGRLENVAHDRGRALLVSPSPCLPHFLREFDFLTDFDQVRIVDAIGGGDLFVIVDIAIEAFCDFRQRVA
jgi:hypothetical protein